MFKPSKVLYLKDDYGCELGVYFNEEGCLQICDSHDEIIIPGTCIQELVGFLMTEHLQEEIQDE